MSMANMQKHSSSKKHSGAKALRTLPNCDLSIRVLELGEKNGGNKGGIMGKEVGSMFNQNISHAYMKLSNNKKLYMSMFLGKIKSNKPEMN